MHYALGSPEFDGGALNFGKTAGLGKANELIGSLKREVV